MRPIDADALIVDEETCQKTFCKNCKAYIRNCEDFFDILAGAPTISADDIDSQPRKPKWIPVKSERPPRSGKYLVTRHEYEYDYGSRYSSVELVAWDSRVGWLDKKRGEGVIAWWSERIPNPYKVS